MLDSFSIIFGMSTIAALIWLGWAPSDYARRAASPSRLMAAGMAALVGGLFGARLVYVVLHWSHFLSHPLEALALWTGGLSGFGGFIGALAGIWLFARRGKHQFWELADALARPAAIMGAAVWAGCWMTSCAYGLPVDWGILQPDIFGLQAARWPAALLAALAAAGWALVLPRLEEHFSSQTSGQVAGLTVTWLGFTMLGVSLLRADPTILYGGIRQETWGAAIMIGIGSIVWIRRLRTAKGVQPQ
jgi:prolipoprotein diacylglyceryltransferase